MATKKIGIHIDLNNESLRGLTEVEAVNKCIQFASESDYEEFSNQIKNTNPAIECCVGNKEMTLVEFKKYFSLTCKEFTLKKQ